MSQVEIRVHVRGQLVSDNGNGTVTLAIIGREINQQERNVLDQLFPHTHDQIEELLATECLLGAVTSKAEANRETNYVSKKSKAVN